MTWPGKALTERTIKNRTANMGIRVRCDKGEAMPANIITDNGLKNGFTQQVTVIAIKCDEVWVRIS